MYRFIFIRFVQALSALLVITALVFSLIHLSGDPVRSMLPDDARPAQVEALRRHMGFDQPLPVQYLLFLKNAAQGDFGQSTRQQGKSAMGAVLERLPATLKLGGLALFLSVVVALPLGVLSAVWRGSRFDTIANIISLLGQSLPTFWVGIMFIWIFAVQLGWFPTSGYGGLSHMILPAVAMAWFKIAALTRLTRSSMLEVLDAEYIKLARVKGVREPMIVWKHAFRNAAIVPLTYFGVLIGALLTGSVVVEAVFAWPGTGALAIEAIRGRDFPVVQAVILLFAVVFLLANFLVDVLYALIDPRIRY